MGALALGSRYHYPSWPGIARRKTRVNALKSRPSTSLTHKEKPPGRAISPISDCAHGRHGQAGASFAQWNRYNPPASPCLRRGKGQPLREEKGEPL
jgi:hypothetical protein